MRTLLAIIVMSVFLASCASSLPDIPPVTTQTQKPNGDIVTETKPATVAIQESMDLAEKTCWEAEKENGKVDCTGLDKMECLMLKMQHETTRLVAAATGHSLSPCGRKRSVVDIFETEVVQQNETARQAIKTSGDVATVGIGVGGGVALGKIIAENAGNKSTTQNGDIENHDTRTEDNDSFIQADTDGSSNGPNDNRQDIVPEPTGEQIQ